VLRARPCGEIIAAFGHELEREIGSNAMDPGQILSKQGMERFADVEVRSIRLPAPAPR
jgi:DNA-directed RNA polymerase subunit N (RpoN/RPB10)